VTAELTNYLAPVPASGISAPEHVAGALERQDPPHDVVAEEEEAV
jgi:hypothetical protein